MLRAIAQNGRLFDALQALPDLGELLDDPAEVGAIVGRLLEFLELFERRFHTLADRRHFTAEVGGEVFDRLPQRLESGGRIAGVVRQYLRVESFFPIVVRHGVSYRSIPMLWLRPRVRLRSMSRARLSLCRTWPIPRSCLRLRRIDSACGSRSRLFAMLRICPSTF